MSVSGYCIMVSVWEDLSESAQGVAFMGRFSRRDFGMGEGWFQVQ